ncbi:MAG: hypothetical protein ACI85O_002244 [Saprospiraceae bacterium]|jgi:hypothetical protein
MKKLLILLAFIASQNLFAQQDIVPVDINWGPEYSEPAGTYISRIIANIPGGFTALRRKQAGGLNPRERVWVEQYTSKMKLKRSEELDLKYKKKVRDFEDVIMLGGKLWYLTSFNNIGKKKNYLFAQKLSSRLVPDRNLQLVGEIDSKNKVREGRFDTHISTDSTKLLIYNQLPYERNTPERFAFRVFDKNMNELWKKNITLPYADDVFAVKEYRVDGDGNVYVLGIIYESRGARTQVGGRPAYRYTVLAYTQNGEEKQEYKIDLRDKFITDLTFRVGRDKDLILAGFYSERNASNAKGTCYLRIDSKSKQILQQTLKEFEFEFLTEEMTEGQRRRAERAEQRGDSNREAELYSYRLDDLILRSDGGVVLIGEQYYVYQDRTQDYYSGRFSTTYYYNYNDIIVVNIQPDGEIEWASRIPKRQRTVNDGGYFSSYAMSITRGKLYFVYNDNARNLDPERRNRIFNFSGSGSVIAVAQVDMKGEVKTFPIQNNRDASVYTRPKVCKQNGKRTMAIYGEDGRKYRFGQLLFE